MDFRGRIYSEVTYLSYQGPDLVRSLINFSKGEKISQTGIYYLKIYTANVYGLTNKTFEDRLKWLEDNYLSFISLYYDDYPAFIAEVSKAKEPFQFFAAFLELISIIENNKQFSSFPILFDCSCSGIQHLSALCGDISIAKMVNVYPDNNNNKSDIYNIASEYITNKILVSNDPKIIKYRESLSKIIINRNIMKIPIMTTPYNISLEGTSDKLVDTLIESKE